MTTKIFEAEIPPEFGYLVDIRREVDLTLEDQTSERTRRDVMLVLSELCTNAMKSTGPDGPAIGIRVTHEGEAIVVEVEDQGVGFSFHSPDLATPLADDTERGRGLQLVLALTEELCFARLAGRTIVRASIGGGDTTLNLAEEPVPVTGTNR